MTRNHTKNEDDLQLISVEARLDGISETFVLHTQTQARWLDDFFLELVTVLPQPYDSIVRVPVPSFQILKLSMPCVIQGFEAAIRGTWLRVMQGIKEGDLLSIASI